METGSNTADEAAELARRAADAASELKVGTWDSVQALALVSIAKSLSVIAASSGS